MTTAELVRAALQEDLPQGDLTTDSLGFPPRLGRARLLAKQDMVLSGSSLFEQSVQILEPQCQFHWHFSDAKLILKNQVICTLQGDLVQILKAERVALNFLMHLSGIATLTRRFVDAVQGTRCRILDTRKTLPTYRELEKRAVLHGGGHNHRSDLSSMVLIKDNHIRLAGGITKAIERIRQHSLAPMIVEAETLEEVRECLEMHKKHPIYRILLDNMSEELMAQCLKLLPPEIESEASGNMSLERVPRVARLGVACISVGALTHSAPSCDISLKFDWENPIGAGS